MILFALPLLRTAIFHDKQLAWISQLLVYLEGNYQLLNRMAQSAVPEMVISPLEATYLVWLDLSFLGMGDKELNNFIIQKAGLGLNNGPMFGPGGEHHQRMNIATPSKVVEEGVGRLIRAIGELR